MRAKEVNFSGLTIHDLRLLKLIGQGNWADVYLAEDTSTLQKAAVKVTPLKKLKQVPKLQELVQAEITILKQCRSPNVVRLLKDFQHAEHQFIVLQYCSGFELGEILLRDKRMEEPLAVNYLKQILNGFKGLHEVRAMHRDFKVENVMLHEGVCKIVDLGFGKQLMGEEVTRTKLGSNLTMAPEVMQGLPYDFRADIWSIGVVFFQMLFGRFPIFARSPTALLEKARKGQYTFDGVEISEESKDFLGRCLKFDPEQRINWLQIYRHRLIADENNEVIVGPPQSKINVQQNEEFYLSVSQQLKKEVVPFQAVRPSIIRSRIAPIRHEQHRQPYQEPRYKQEGPRYHSEQARRAYEQPAEEAFQKQKTQIFLSEILEQAEPSDPSHSQQVILSEMARRNEQLTEELLRGQRIKVANIVRNIKYRYMERLENIEFISRYTLATMRETHLKCEISHTPVLCLLFKDTYLRLDQLDDHINFSRNIFQFDEVEFKYFQSDEQVPVIVKRHLKEYKELFEEFCGFLAEEEYKDDRLRKVLQDIKNREDFSTLLDEYLCKHAKTVAKSDLSDNSKVFCKLLKLAFCLKKYSQHKDRNFSQRRILAKINYINSEQDYFRQLGRASRDNRAPNRPCPPPLQIQRHLSVKSKICSTFLSIFGVHY